MATVFVSYSHADKKLADAVARGLEERGLGVWIDSKGLRIGDSIITRIATAIAEGDFLLALVSAASRNSNWCRKEIALAMTEGINNRRVTVLPLRVGDVEMPPELNAPSCTRRRPERACRSTGSSSPRPAPLRQLFGPPRPRRARTP